MSCIDCIQNTKQQQEAINSLKRKAKQFAISKQENVFLYVKETGELDYMVESAARQIGIQPVQILSGLIPATQ